MDLIDISLWTALITPLNENGSIDFESLEHLLSMQSDAQNGALLLGSTGEGANLTLKMKQDIIEFVDKLENTPPVMVAIGGTNLDSQLDWINYLEKFKWISSYLMVTPIYSKPGIRGQYHWFKTLLDKATKPCMLYNVPGRSGIKLHLETVMELAEHPNFYAIKEASGDLNDFKEYIENLTNIKIYSGDDALFYEQAKLGAHGLVSIAGNVWPQSTKAYVNKAMANNLDNSKLWKECSETLFIASNPVPVKKLLYIKKIIKYAHLHPPLHTSDFNADDKIINADKKIDTWFKGL